VHVGNGIARKQIKIRLFVYGMTDGLVEINRSILSADAIIFQQPF
jgi:hypothetical protein